MTESWIQFKNRNKMKRKKKTNLNQFCALALCLMVLWWVRGKRRATFRIHVCISHSHRIRFDFVPAIHMEIEVCFAERLLHPMHSNRIEAIAHGVLVPRNYIVRSSLNFSNKLSCPEIRRQYMKPPLRPPANSNSSGSTTKKPNAIRSNLVTFGVPA